jgi:CTP synthase (UTP-ammonia lyase)
LTKTVEIVMVGKYTTQLDTYTSIVKALEHAGLESNRKVLIKVNEIKLTQFCSFISSYSHVLRLVCGFVRFGKGY